MQHRSDCTLRQSNIFALKGGGYGCLFSLTGIDEEGVTDLELDSRLRSCRASTFRARQSMPTRSRRCSRLTV
jgi:hypothetical protein